MKLRDVVGGADLAVYPEIALLIFLSAFLLIAWRVMSRKASDYDEVANLPLEGDEGPLVGRPDPQETDPPQETSEEEARA